MIWFALVLWAFLASALAVLAVQFFTRRKHFLQIKAYRAILHDRGIDLHDASASEVKRTIKIVHQRETSGDKTPSMRPVPVFARSVLERPKSRPSWITEPSPTQHSGGHTRDSLAPAPALAIPPPAMRRK